RPVRLAAGHRGSRRLANYRNAVALPAQGNLARSPLSARLTVCRFELRATVVGNDGNEIRLIDRSAAIKAAHRTTDVLRIGSSQPRVHSEQTFKLAIGSVQVMTSVVSSRHVGASTIHKSKLMFETFAGNNSLICGLLAEGL